MVILKKIKRNNGMIEADYYPEGGSSQGHLSVDITSGELLEHKVAPGHEYSSAVYHAQRDLLRICRLNVLPVERTVVWY